MTSDWGKQEAERIVGDAIGRAIRDQDEARTVMATYPPESFAYQAAEIGLRLAEVKQAVSRSLFLRTLARVIGFLGAFGTEQK